MRIYNKHVKTVFDVELTYDDVMNILDQLGSKKYIGWEITHPKAFKNFNMIDANNFCDVLFNTHGDTYTVIAEILGFDGWANAGAPHKPNGTYRMQFYKEGCDNVW